MVQTKHILGDLQVEQAYSRGVRSISLNEPLETALHATLNSFQSSFPICEEGNLAGMLPYSTPVRALEKKDLLTPIREVMQTGIKPVTPRDTLIQVQKRISLEGLDALPVVDELGGFLGMITNRDHIIKLYTLEHLDVFRCMAGNIYSCLLHYLNSKGVNLRGFGSRAKGCIGILPE